MPAAPSVLPRRGADDRQRMRFARHFSSAEQTPEEAIAFALRDAVITEPDGSVVFEMKDLEVPANWSQLATDILASKYLRKAGVPESESGQETSVKQVVRRISAAISAYGQEQDYFASEADAQVFEDELAVLLYTQRGAFNSPVWFNCGLHHRYGIQGGGGNFHYDEEQDRALEIANAYAHPQCSACFIQRVQDSLHAIFDLVRRESRVFKYGSGTGTNFSVLRSKYEKLSGGGTSSGVMSFLEVFDKGAGATKSGGTTRRAAKMVILDVDHPEIVDFIRWKAREEEKAKILIGAGLPADFNGEAYATVSGQNANNSVRVSDAFMQAYQQDATWETHYRTDGEVHQTHRARELMREMAEAAHACADPGIQFDTTINDWHTCAARERINASNPCSEFMFLDDTACNLASLNLMRFHDVQSGEFLLEDFRVATRVFATAMEILVGFSSYPTAEICENSHAYRPLGLGYANLGTLLMVRSLPYDSDKGRALAATLTAILCGEAYAVSAELAACRGAFAGFAQNRESMLRVIGKHRQAAVHLPHEGVPEALRQAAQDAWQRAEAQGQRHGYRNAQMTVLAPTGTIGLLMDCDTTGVEPDFALVKWKKLAGGGNVKIVNQSLPLALRNLGYTEPQVEDIVQYILGATTLQQAIGEERLQSLGLRKNEIAAAEAAFAEKRVWNEHVPHANPASLVARGVDEKTIKAIQARILGTETIEGAPHLKEEHLAVFDCANRCGPKGERFIAPPAHVRMMAAVQPFISGAISKTINMPQNTSVEAIEELYVEAWRQGLKSVAVYRDGSKGSQPLSTGLEAQADENPKAERQPKPAGAIASMAWGERHQLPRERQGFTVECAISGHKLFLRTGEYQDGTLGEIFIDMYKEGASYRSMMNSFAQAVSVGLSYGVPLKKYVDMFTFTRFEPYGFTDHPQIRTCTSLLDFIFRLLGARYLGRADLLHVDQAKALDTRSDGLQADGVRGFSQSTQLAEAVRASQAVLSDLGAPLGSAPAAGGANPAQKMLASLMGDGPICDACGHVTVRNGSCYRCLNCGNSLGCS